MTYAVTYRDTDQMSHDERAWYLSQIDEAVRLLPEGWAVDSDLWHEPTSAYPTVDWETRGVRTGRQAGGQPEACRLPRASPPSLLAPGHAELGPADPWTPVAA